MRKTVLFVIAMVFALSIVLINFFGLKMRTEQFKTYVTKVEFVNPEIEDMGDIKLWYAEYEDNSNEGRMDIDLDWKCSPEIADDNEVSFALTSDFEVEDEDNEFIVYNEEHEKWLSLNKQTGSVKCVGSAFKAEDTLSIVVRIQAEDGSNKSDQITIIIVKTNG